MVVLHLVVRVVVVLVLVVVVVDVVVVVVGCVAVGPAVASVIRLELLSLFPNLRGACEAGAALGAINALIKRVRSATSAGEEQQLCPHSPHTAPVKLLPRCRQ